MDAAEFLERAGLTADTEPVQRWERDRLVEDDWKRVEHDRPFLIERVPFANKGAPKEW